MKNWTDSFVGMLLTVLVASGKDRPTVLAFGDSITEGGGSFVCYREVLVPGLKELGVGYEFIGPKRDRVSAHAGYSGKNTSYLRKVCREVYGLYPADYVLLHSGHNSFSKDMPVPGILADTEAIIQTVLEVNPSATVLLAQVIPAGKLPKYSYIPELNEGLCTLSGRLQKEGARVVLVDQARGFDWRTDTVADKVHPNAAGAKKMAGKWMDALVPLMGKLGRERR